MINNNNKSDLYSFKYVRCPNLNCETRTRKIFKAFVYVNEKENAKLLPVAETIFLTCKNCQSHFEVFKEEIEEIRDAS